MMVRSWMSSGWIHGCQGGLGVLVKGKIRVLMFKVLPSSRLKRQWVCACHNWLLSWFGLGPWRPGVGEVEGTRKRTAFPAMTLEPHQDGGVISDKKDHPLMRPARPDLSSTLYTTRTYRRATNLSSLASHASHLHKTNKGHDGGKSSHWVKPRCGARTYLYYYGTIAWGLILYPIP